MFIERHTPDEIRIANNARRQLNKVSTQPRPPGSNQRLVARKVRLLGDQRALKRPDTPYIQFFRERHASGDLRGMHVTDAAKEIGREWRNLSRQEAQVSLPCT